MPRTLPATGAPAPPYLPPADTYDEAFEPDGTPRPAYTELIAALERTDLGHVEETMAAELRARGVRFGTAAGHEPFRLDLVPRLFEAGEWTRLEAGCIQRVRALNAFVADAYGERAMVSAGRLPARVIDTAEQFEPSMVGALVPGGVWTHVAGLDIVRDAEGRFMVLEDNLRTPSGIAYALAARGAVRARLPGTAAPRSLGGAFAALAASLRAAAPGGNDDPAVALLSDGPANSAWYEHRELARRLGLAIVTLDQLEVRDGRLFARTGRARGPIDVLYRRTDCDSLRDEKGDPTRLAEILEEPCRRGLLGCVNAFGTGVADDKLAHVYVEEMVRFYLGEEPLLPSVPSYDLGRPDLLEMALDRLPELVIKPRSGYGGHGVVICAHATREDRDRVAAAIAADPGNFVAQETLMLSTHPTFCDGRLEPRHVDLRPFVYMTPERVRVVPGGLTRVALGEGALVVNSSQRGGAKDTWVLPA